MELLEGLDLDTSRQDFFQDVVAVLIMLTTMFGGLVAYLETDASTRADRADRQSQVYAIQAMGERLRATQRDNYDVQVYATANELDRRAQDAMARAGAMGRVPGMSAGVVEHQDAATRWEAARDRIRSLSPLLSDMRYQPSDDIIRFDQYFEESLVKARGKAEWQRAMTQQGEAWENKARGYLSIITILAVGLFLFGLSLTIPGVVRYILVGAGVLIVTVSGVWAALVYAQPAPEAREDAIQAYLRGVTALNVRDYDAAITHFDEATVLDARLGGAWADRGYARAQLGDPAAIERGIADFEQAIRLGVDNSYTRRNLGRLYVKQHAYDQAIDNFRAALDQESDQAMLYFDLGLTLFVSGQEEPAREAYHQGITLLSKEPGYIREPSFQAAINDLQDATMMGDMMHAGSALVSMLKEASASLMMMGEMQPHDMGVTFGPPTFEVGEAGLAATFEYQGMQDGLLWQDRWYVDGQVDDNLSPAREPWSDGTSGQWTVSISDPERLKPGTYRVELYVEGQLVQSGETTIGQGMMTSMAMMSMSRYESRHLAVSLERPAQWRLVGGGEDHEFVAFAARRDMAFFILTTKRYDTTSTSDPNFQALAEELDSQQGMHSDLQQAADVKPVAVGGRQGPSVEYTYTDGDQQLRGVIVAVTSEAGLTYRIRFEALADAFEAHRPTFEAMLDSLTFRDTS